ncbi:DUF445 family protein [Wansuia hejianensis]|uniref:DUF445 family protein n=1 Tax=Wansuia hejianensis TaxID=2763667 RepID=A0A926F0N4_9FIRM|nr:DUF445 family protein [Wansuia hejianensis]MBC8591201.1 DUF445 family protein [Wansuia hejianensis]
MDFIIPAIVGSIIGYITNWLAIKMLFRPYEEKKIFGFKLPFTPGLIPKERYRIAKSVGNTVGEYLLTPEKITEVLSGEEAQKKIRSWIDLKLSYLKNNSKSLEDIITTIDNRAYNEAIENIEARIFNLFIRKLKDDKAKEKIVRFLEENIYEKYKDQVLKAIEFKGKYIIDDFSKSHRIKEALLNGINMKISELENRNIALKEIIPEEILGKLYNSVDQNKDIIMKSVRELFNDATISNRIKNSIEEIVLQNVSKVITMFVQPEIISNKVYSAIERYINSNESEEVVSFILKNTIHKILETEISSLTKQVLSCTEEEDIYSFMEWVLAHISKEEIQDKLMDIIVENINSKDKEIKEGMLSIVSSNLDKIIDSMEFEESIQRVIHNSIKGFMNQPLSKTFKEIDKDSTTRISDFINKLFNTIGKDELINIVRMFNISKVVEDQINSFEVEFAEELILEIAHKELKAITSLGALLGAIMGIVTPLLQRIQF